MNEQIQELAEEASKQIGMVGFHNIPKEFIAQFGYLLLEEIMQTLIITGHEDAVDTLNKHLGIEE